MELLIKMGYKSPQNDFKTSVLDVHNAFYKRVDNPLVECEEHGDKISFQCIEYAVYSHLPPQYEMSITFCKNGIWWNLKAYSINQSDFTKETIERTEFELIKMFKTLKTEQ